MYETHLTAVGTLITRVERFRFADGTTKAHFRIACNERRFDRAADRWTNGATLYLSVNCWRDLAENVLASFVIGDPIIVRGRLLTREWEKDGRRNSVTELEAAAVGPDLSRSTARIARTKRSGSAAGEQAGEAGPMTVGGAGEPDAAPGHDRWSAGDQEGPDTDDRFGSRMGDREDTGLDDEWSEDVIPELQDAGVEAAARG